MKKKKKKHLSTPRSCSDEAFIYWWPRNAVGSEYFVCELTDSDPGAFTYCARKKKEQKKQQRSSRKICRDRLFLPPNAVLHQALLNRKTSYLMQYLVSDTNMESVSSSKKRKKKQEKINYVYIYLTNVKGFFLFMCESCESKILFIFFFWFTVNILFISHCASGWMFDWTVWPSLWMWTVCVCERNVSVSLKKMVWMTTLSVRGNA